MGKKDASSKKTDNKDKDDRTSKDEVLKKEKRSEGEEKPPTDEYEGKAEKGNTSRRTTSVSKLTLEDESRKDGEEVIKDKKSDVQSIGIDRKLKAQKLEGDGIVRDDTIASDRDQNLSPVLNLNLSDIWENLQLVLAGAHSIRADDVYELVEVGKASIELPKRITTGVEPEMTFQTSTDGSWCLAIGRVRTPLASWSNYLEFLSVYRHIVEGGVKEQFRIFQIRDTEYVNQRQIINPIKLGFGADITVSCYDALRNLYFHSAEAFAPINDNAYRDTVRIVQNPVLADFVLLAQQFLFDGNQEGQILRDWVETYVQRRTRDAGFNLRMVYGRNNTQWVRCAHPRRLSTLLSVLPNANYISVAYSLHYISPVFSTRAVKISALADALKVSMTSADATSNLATSPVTAENIRDFQRIMSALLLPGQIHIEIEYDITEASVLLAVSALCAKLLFSTSITSRNITYQSCYASDAALSKFLQSAGYRCANNAQPLDLTLPRGPGRPSLFAELTTRDNTGDGWCNMNCRDFADVPIPLYDGIGRVPMIGNIQAVVNIDLNTMGTVRPPPILEVMKRCLHELSQNFRSKGDSVAQFFFALETNYIEFIQAFNRHCLLFCETGFRLNDMTVNDMQNVANVGGLYPSLNSPVVYRIKYDSVYKFFRALPSSLDPPQHIASQPAAESLISAELQRVFSAFMIMLERLRIDGNSDGFTPRAVFARAVESTKANHFAKKIIDLCLRDGSSSRLSIDRLRGLRAIFDDFEAVLFHEYAQIVNEHPESFGFTFDVVRTLISVGPLSEEQYNILRRTGIISTNTLAPEFRDDVAPMSWAEMRIDLLNYRLLSAFRRSYRTIPIPIRYREEVVDILEDDSVAPMIVTNVNDSEIQVGTREEISVNTFTRKILRPTTQRTFRPDQMCFSAEFLRFWIANDNSNIFTFSPQRVLGDWMRPRVYNWKPDVVFRSPLNLTNENDSASEAV